VSGPRDASAFDVFVPAPIESVRPEAVEVVLDPVLLMKTRNGLGRLGPEVSDHVIAAEFERDEVIDFVGAARLGVRDAVLLERLSMNLGGDAPSLLRRLLAHDDHISGYHGPRSARGVRERAG
jgi:hypothetical protein